MTTAVTETLPRDRALRRAFSVYPTGVVALAAEVDGRAVGMAVNSFISVSLEPALVAISAARTSRTWPVLREVPELGMSVLAAHHAPLSRLLSSREKDRFGAHPWRRSAQGAVLVHDAALWLTCRLHGTFDGGDHEIALYEISEVTVFDDVEPLVFQQSRYRAISPSEFE
ncbi:MAG: flavin reductase family protein [Microbacterium sp.]|uniref:flavin reductase family protein n=1 Tax=Microbacterium gubbeenense TaxID=159896 RepID=UPI003F9B7EDA